VIQSRVFLASAATALVLAFHPLAGLAQTAPAQGPGWFVPNQARPAPPARPPGRPAPGAAQGPVEVPADAIPGPVDDNGQPQAAQQIQVQLPPAPEIPAIPKGPATPAAIVGILSVPDVLRISTAYQEADKALSERHKKLDEDAQKEQVALRDLGQALTNDRAKMTPEQIRQKERELQDRIADSRRKFGERNRIIQEAGQYIMAQINRTLEQVAQQVALSRGVNLVLNRAQILGTTADFDLTPQVAEVLNKALPAVVIPPDGVSPLTLTPAKSEPGAPPAAAAAEPPVKPVAAAPAKH
jgi:Skp family chaperone for outer membrane proteins